MRIWLMRMVVQHKEREVVLQVVLFRQEKAREGGSGRLKADAYLTTELIRKQKEEEKKQKEDIDKLQKLLNIGYEQALAIYNQTRTQENVALKRPDLYLRIERKILILRLEKYQFQS